MRKKSVLFLMIVSAVVFCGCGNKKAPEADAPSSAGQQAKEDGEQTAGAFGDKTQGDGSTETGAEEDMRAGEGAGAGQEDADGTAPEKRIHRRMTRGNRSGSRRRKFSFLRSLSKRWRITDFSFLRMMRRSM